MMKLIKRENGNIATLIIIIMIIGVFVYIFSTKEEDDSLDITREEHKAYIDHSIAAQDVIRMLASNEILLKEKEVKPLKNQNFSISVKRGEDYKHPNGYYMCFLIETVDLELPTQMHQFMVIAIPKGMDEYDYHIVLMRKQKVRG